MQLTIEVTFDDDSRGEDDDPWAWARLLVDTMGEQEGVERVKGYVDGDLVAETFSEDTE
jgi:hypothetical protein